MAKRGTWSIKEELLIKSREAMLSAVQIFNNPNIQFKSETYIVLSTIAWTYLLHAYYRGVGVEYRYHNLLNGRKKFDKTKRKAFKFWELERCLNCDDSHTASEIFWRKMGFQKMPAIDGYSNNNTPSLYKTLLAVQESSIFNTDHIQLYKWGTTERQCWPISYKPGTNELTKPIITPASGDWCIDYVKSELSERAVKVKNFRLGNYFDDPFLIITELL